MAEAGVAIRLTIVGQGWLNCELRVGEQNFCLEWLSDITDVLGDLVRLALALATGAWTARATFDREPERVTLVAGAVFDRDQMSWRDGFHVRALNLLSESGPDEAGHKIFDVGCSSEDFINAILAEAKCILKENGAHYSWGLYPFPLRALRALETALATKDPPLTPSPL